LAWDISTVSPLSLRRYRAERLLRQQFETLRDRVLSAVRRRLRAAGVSLDDGDLDACYAQAWQGLFTVTLEGHEISNPAAWLVTVTFRRAIDEHRSRRRLGWPWRERPGDRELAAAPQHATERERDLASELDDRARLRQLFEALRGRLSAREREAAVLCYLQGLPRAQAAARMGVSEARMRKLMDGRGGGRPGVAGEVGRFLETIRRGAWCEEQVSLMRGLAFGLLDPEGERYRLALMHGRQCPACRAYVASLRGLAAALPPTLIAPDLAAAILDGASAGRGVAGAVSANRAAATAANGAAASAGSGAARGGGLLGGPLAAKLAAGGLVALGLGAGSAVLAIGSGRAGARPPLHASRRPPGPSERSARTASGHPITATSGPAARSAQRAGRRRPAPSATGPASAAAREFGPERRRTVGGTGPVAAGSARSTGARAAARATAPFGLEFAPG
jgi:RNA polymerase sigma factor (sigma-70 family)